MSILKGLFKFLFQKENGNKRVEQFLEKKSEQERIHCERDSREKTKDKNNLRTQLDEKKMPENELEKEVITIFKNIRSKKNEVFWNVYPTYRKYNGEGYVQVDIVYVTENKVYVIECKDYKTCINIMGNKEMKNWEYKYKNKSYKSLNPIYQNEVHISVLAEYLNLDEKYFESIVVFITGNNIGKVVEADEIIYLKDEKRKELEAKIKMKINKNIGSLNQNKKLDIEKISNDLFEVMNPSEEIVAKHKEYIEKKRKSSSKGMSLL